MNTMMLEQAIYSGIQFLFNAQNADKGISGTYAGTGASSCWLCAETLEFINDAFFLPSEIFNFKNDMIDFLLREQTDEGYWPMVVSDVPSPSAITTGHSVYALKKSLNYFMQNSKQQEILSAITKGENWLLKNQSLEGFWIEGGEDNNARKVGEKASLSEKLVCTYYAYLGIKNETVYSYHNRDDLIRAEKKTINFFAGTAENIINKEGKSFTHAGMWLSAVSRAYLVLSKYYNDYQDLCDDLYAILKRKKDNFYSTGMVRLSSISVDGNKAVTNNTPFDCYFALMEKGADIDLINEIIEYFIKTQDSISKCWYLNGDSETSVNTWTTCEALMVLGKAYKEYNILDLKINENRIYSEREELEREKQDIDIQKRNINEMVTSAVADRTNNLAAKCNNIEENYKKYKSKIQNHIIFYASASIIASIGCIILLIMYSYNLKRPFWESLINLFVIPLGINIVFTLITTIKNLKRDIKEREETT